jgi:hypothetical protein
MKTPDTLRLDVGLSALQKLLIDQLRGDKTPEQFLYRMIELGLSELLYNLARYHREGMITDLAAETIGDHENARAILFRVKNADAEPPTTPAPTPEPQTNGADPSPNHLPRGIRR